MSLEAPHLPLHCYISLNCSLANVLPRAPVPLNVTVIENYNPFPQAQKRALCNEIQRQQPFGVWSNCLSGTSTMGPRCQ